MEYILALVIVVTVVIVCLLNTYGVERTAYTVDSSSTGFKVVHITDLHGRITYLNGKLSQMVNQACPDVVVITGDLANNLKRLPRVIADLARINCPHIYFVPGNHEREQTVYFRKRKLADEQYRQITNSLRKIHIKVLENHHVIADVNGSKVLIHGFDNSIYGNETYNHGLNKVQCDYKIVLAHSPSIIHKMNQWQMEYNLLLVGHTHGGQIRIFQHSYGAYKDFHTGLKKIAPHCYFLINRGLGTVRLPFRLNCRPELAVIYIGQNS